MGDSKASIGTKGKGPPWQRRLFHAFAGSLPPLTGIFVPIYPLTIALACLATISLALDLTRFRVSWLNRLFLRWLRPLLKDSKEGRVTGATYLLFAALLVFLLFDPPVAIAVLLFLALGDPAAALVGSRMPGPRLFGKSPMGTLAFIGVSMLAALALAATDVVAPFSWVFLVGAVVAGLVELAPLPLDDNLTVPLIAGAAMQYLPLLLGYVL